MVTKRFRKGTYDAYFKSRNAKRQRVVKRAPKRKLRGARTTRVHTFSRRLLALTDEINGLFFARQYSFTFDQMVEHTEFGALFEKYRIDRIIMKFQLINNPDATWSQAPAQNSQNNFNNWFPKMWYAVDDDGGTTDTIATMKERQGVKCRILQPNKTVTVSFKPKVRVLTYQTATAQGFGPKSLTIDMSNVAVPHYGLSVVYDTNGIDPSDTYPFKINVEVQYKFTCMGVR